MINFFRRLRQRLLTENKVSRYFFYAFGEIVLVVIGILIALSINNWNESQKESALQKVYLKGIAQDLKKDVEQANAIIEDYLVPLNIINGLEPHFKLDAALRLENIDTTSLSFTKLFLRPNSFRSTKGTYSSLIADGKSNLIKNKILFQKVQSIYDEQQIRVFSIYDDFKDRENRMFADYSYEKYHWNYKMLIEPKNNKTLATLANFWDSGKYYCLYLNELILKMDAVIDEINKELEGN